MPVAGDLTISMLACAALLIRVGFGWYAAGLSRSKNAAGAVFRNVADLSIAALVFWAVGAAVLNKSTGLLFDAKGSAGTSQLVQLVLVLIATAPVAGAAAERCRFFPMLAAPALLAGVVIPICGSWAWRGGWLQRMGYFDVAGASVIHVAGGLCAAVAALMAGPRAGKYNRDGSSNLIPGHSVPMASVGVLLMLAAWAPYVMAAAAMNSSVTGRIAWNVLLAAAAGTLSAILISHARYGKPDIMLTYGGLLGALVAISGSGGAVSSIGAVVIGAVAGVLVPTATVMLDLVWKMDDPSGGVAIHVVGGAWGTLAVGLMGPARDVAEKLHQLGVQLLGLVVITAFSLSCCVALFAVLKKTVGLRLKEVAEFDGADLAEHDVNAYPDFQQTMIKSYHLREA
jgi:Amt family ammonium transporter